MSDTTIAVESVRGRMEELGLLTPTVNRGHGSLMPISS